MSAEGRFHAASQPQREQRAAVRPRIELALPAEEVVPQRAFTLRGWVVGLLGCLVIAVGDQYGINVIQGSYMAIDFTTPAAIALLFFLAMPVNTALRAISPRLALTSQELALCFIMFIIACSLSTMGHGAQLLPIISVPDYYGRAHPESGWKENILPHLPQWLVPSDPDAIKAFYEKTGENPKVLWQPWVKPLLGWAPFLLMLYFVMITMSVLLRRQWVEHERLVFPLAQLPIEMCRTDAHRFFAPFFRNKILWAGFLTPMIVSSMTALHSYFPTIPAPVLAKPFPPPEVPAKFRLMFRLSFPMLGFLYLVHMDMLFSLWFFNLLAQTVRSLVNMEWHPAIMFLRMNEDQGIYGAEFVAYKHLGTGAMMVLVLVGLWNARGHLKQVFRSAISHQPSAISHQEILPYPVAFWGTILGLIGMGVWLYLSGITAWVMPIFLIYVWVFFIGLTRVVAESGLGEAVASAIAPPMTVSTVGTAPLGSKGLAALALSYVWCSDIRTYPMASAIHGLKIADTFKLNRLPLFFAMMAAIVVTAVAANAALLYLGYKHGAINLNKWFLVNGPPYPYKWAAARLGDAKSKLPFRDGYVVRGVGALIMLLLMVARRRFTWWVFHPLGFCVSTVWLMDQIWFTCFLAWVLKGLILRYLGLRGFQQARPFFLGLILGQFTCNALWLIIDGFTGKVGNMVFWI